MKYTIDYLPPFRSDWINPVGDHNEWAITAMVIYRDRKQALSTDDPPSGCYQLFWPENPWDALDKINFNVDFKNGMI